MRTHIKRPKLSMVSARVTHFRSSRLSISKQLDRNKGNSSLMSPLQGRFNYPIPSRAKAREMLLTSGIIDATGELSVHYRN
jgi:hypothetical protein